MGIDLEKDFLPCFGGIINLAVKKATTTDDFDNFILYLPMRECSISGMFLKKVRWIAKNIFGREKGRFGEEKIDKVDSFWFIDGRGIKINFLEVNKKICLGNNINLIKTMIRNKDKNCSDINNGSIKKVDKNTFLFMYTIFDNESFLKAVLELIVYNIDPKLNNLIDKISTIKLIGKKHENYFTFDFNVIMVR